MAERTKLAVIDMVTDDETGCFVDQVGDADGGFVFGEPQHYVDTHTPLQSAGLLRLLEKMAEEVRAARYSFERRSRRGDVVQRDIVQDTPPKSPGMILKDTQGNSV